MCNSLILFVITKINVLKMRFIKLFLSIVFIANAINVFSQSMQINNIQACSGDTIISEITNSAIDTIGAVTIYINYDTATVKYITMFGFNSQLNGILYNDIKNISGQSVGRIALSWVASSNGVNLNQGIFARIKFLAKDSSCSLQFLPDCEITNYQSQIYNINYIDGNIEVQKPIVIQIQPQVFVESGQNGFISIKTQNFCVKKWQLKMNNVWTDLQNNLEYQCVDCDTLRLINFNTIPNGSLFRCKLSNTCETIFSNSVVVTNTNVVNSENSIFLGPNPFVDYIRINSNAIIEKINIYQSDGKLLFSGFFNDKKNEQNITNLMYLNSGLYFIEILTSQNKSNSQIYKLIKY